MASACDHIVLPAGGALGGDEKVAGDYLRKEKAQPYWLSFFMSDSQGNRIRFFAGKS